MSARRFQDISSALQREIQFVLEEAMARRLDQGAVGANLEGPAAVRSGKDLEEVRVNAMHRAKACAKKSLAKGRFVP